jgi:hypothetical protein
MQLNQQKLIFDARFWRSHRTLHFIACRVLGDHERAEEAIGSCSRRASRHPQWFEHEGEFYSWLLRILIDEALVLICESMPMTGPKVLSEPVAAEVIGNSDISGRNGDISDGDQDRFSQDLYMGAGIVAERVFSKQGEI